MKFRDKETGKIQTCDMVVITDEPIDGEIASLNKHTFIFRSVEQFNDNCESYKPTEPLIDNEEIREIIRAWAKANDATELRYDVHENSLTDIYRNTISFNYGLVGLKDEHSYTILELCGDEEE